MSFHTDAVTVTLEPVGTDRLSVLDRLSPRPEYHALVPSGGVVYDVVVDFASSGTIAAWWVPEVAVVAPAGRRFTEAEEPRATVCASSQPRNSRSSGPMRP